MRWKLKPTPSLIVEEPLRLKWTGRDDMGTTITARYRLTVERMAEGSRVQVALAQGWWSRASLLLCELVASGCLAFVLWNLPTEAWLLAIIVPTCLLVIGTFGLIKFFNSARGHRAIARFVLRRMPEAAREIEWRFSDDLIEHWTALSAASYRWEMVTKVVEAPTGFLIYQGRLLVEWVPGDGFGSPVDPLLFAGLARSRAKEYVLIGECRTEALPTGDGPETALEPNRWTS